MNSKTIDLKLPVFQLCSQYPELLSIMPNLGFTDIVKPGMLQTAGRFMTIPKGAAMKGIDLETVKAVLRENGFNVL
ncbi:MAG: DUF1858 domain-containing protein [Clostridiaceae bacterium]|jgi:hypothetical protein|nr:DUF1858 domain-containing protein [Clostridiaceae bacterium]